MGTLEVIDLVEKKYGSYAFGLIVTMLLQFWVVNPQIEKMHEREQIMRDERNNTIVKVYENQSKILDLLAGVQRVYDNQSKILSMLEDIQEAHDRK